MLALLQPWETWQPLDSMPTWGDPILWTWAQCWPQLLQGQLALLFQALNGDKHCLCIHLLQQLLVCWGWVLRGVAPCCPADDLKDASDIGQCHRERWLAAAAAALPLIEFNELLEGLPEGLLESLHQVPHAVCSASLRY